MPCTHSPKRRKLQLEAIPDALDSTAVHGDPPRSSCHAVYIKTLLACYARPAELSRSQLHRLDNWLEQWSGSVTLEHGYTTSKGDAQPLALDLGSTHGLRPVTTVTHSENMRYLAMMPLSKLLRVKTILLQQGKTRNSWSWATATAMIASSCSLFLHRCWCENRNTRTEARNPVLKHAQLCFDPENIHAQLSGKPSADERQRPWRFRLEPGMWKTKVCWVHNSYAKARRAEG